MFTLEAALQRIASLARPLESETIPLAAADQRVLAEDIYSTVELPGFDNSAMDGYAVAVADLAGASVETPVILRRLGVVAAGEIFSGQVERGTCVRLFTGSPLPQGADAVVMQEDTSLAVDKPGLVCIHDQVKPWENVRLRGEDVKSGALVAPAGQVLNSSTVGLLAAVGVAEVKVGRQPVVGLLATGSELREAGQPLLPGQIYESNRASLTLLARHAGALTRTYPLVADTLEATRAALQIALQECDVVVSSGGVSVGGFDFVKEAFEKVGGKTDFLRVAIKPGKPVVCGRWRQKLFFGVPGNPVSAFVTFLLLVSPALRLLQGVKEISFPVSLGVLAESLTNRGDRRHFMRVCLDSEACVRLAGPQASHSLSSLAQANGLVDVPPESTIEQGATVHVIRWD